jgi:RimK family alpha-L-glutamate ligase
MLKTQLAIITMRDFECCNLYNIAKTKSESNKLPIEITKIYVEDISIEWHFSTIQLNYNNKNILNQFDAFLFRIDLRSNLDKIFFIARTLKNADKFFINSTLANNTTFSDKLSVLNLLQQLNLNHPETCFIDSQKLLKKHSYKFPFILKDPYGWQGDSVYLIKTKQDLKNALKKLPPTGLIMQEYLQINYDVRIIVIGYKALGAIKRINPDNDFRSNLSIGGKAQKIELTNELRDISERIAKQAQSEMLGIDFFLHKNKIYVNEIETCPGFTGFTETTNISPLYELLKYIHTQNIL